jgi:hypothetical protein
LSGLLDEIVAKLRDLPPDERALIEKAAAEATSGMLWIPNPGPQTEAYFSPADLLGYGGQAGGGKSALLCGTALNDHRSSRLFRRHFKDIDGLGGLAPALKEMLGSWDGYSKQTHVWTIPHTEGRAIEFGAFTNEQEAEAYRGRPADYFGFDEAQQFVESLVRFLLAWNRTTAPGQRCRAILTFNPPTTPEELWIFEMFAAWLDERHPNPAKPGELRWYTTIDGKDVEVSEDWRGETSDGLVIMPKSRTFVRARLADNPDLAETGYASQLAQLPKHLRDALMDGKFSAQLDDDDWQVIPTEWVLAAQQRWIERKSRFDAGMDDMGPMHAMGADIAMGGADRMALAPRYGTFFPEPLVKEGVDVKNPRSAAAFIFANVTDDAQVNVDNTGGWGSGVVEHLESNRHPCVSCVFSEASRERSRDGAYFYNKRAEYHWKMREALDPVTGDDIALPPGRRILAQATAARWERVRINGANGIKVRPKDEVIAKLGHSPDEWEAILLAQAEQDALGARRAGHPLGHGRTVKRANSEAKERSRRWREGRRN